METLNRSNAKVGTVVIFRGERRVIAETCAAGVWLVTKKKKSRAHADTARECRDFIYYSEAEKFGVVVEFNAST